MISELIRVDRAIIDFSLSASPCSSRRCLVSIKLFRAKNATVINARVYENYLSEVVSPRSVPSVRTRLSNSSRTLTSTCPFPTVARRSRRVTTTPLTHPTVRTTSTMTINPHLPSNPRATWTSSDSGSNASSTSPPYCTSPRRNSNRVARPRPSSRQRSPRRHLYRENRFNRTAHSRTVPSPPTITQPNPR